MAATTTARSAPQLVADRAALARMTLFAACAGAAGLAALAAYRPMTAFYVALALGGAAVCALRFDVALLILVAASPLEAAFELSPGVSLTKAAGVLCFSSFALYALTSRRRLVLDRSHAIVLAILAIALVSTAAARAPDAALSTTIRYTSFAALYIVVSQLGGEHVLLRRIAWTMSISAAIAGALASHSFLSGETYLAELPYANANDTAYILATTLPFAFWLLREPWVLRPVVIALIASISTAVLFSFSRGAFVGLAAGALWHVATQRKHVPVLLVGALASALVAVYLVRSNETQVATGIEVKQRVATYNVDTRLDAWRAAARLAEQHPVIGIGPGNFRYYFFEATHRPAGSQNLLVVHNAYLDVAAELGIFAALLLLGYLGLMLYRAGVADRAGGGPPGFAGAVRTSLVIAIASAMFLSEQYAAPFWLIGGLATAVWTESRMRISDTR